MLTPCPLATSDTLREKSFANFHSSEVDAFFAVQPPGSTFESAASSVIIITRLRTDSSKNSLAQALSLATFTQFLASWLFGVKYWEMSRFNSYKRFGLIYQMFCQSMLQSNKKDGRLIVMRKRRSQFGKILHRSKLASHCSLYSTHCTYYIPVCNTDYIDSNWACTLYTIQTHYTYYQICSLYHIYEV